MILSDIERPVTANENAAADVFTGADAMLYGEWLDEWLELYVRTQSSERTYKKYRMQSEKYIIPRLGRYPLSELRPLALQRFSTELADNSGLSPGTVNSVLSVLKASLRRSVLLGITEKQYSDSVIRPRARSKQIMCFSVAEQRKIERYIFARRRPALFGILLCLYSGLRIGELLALTWDDVDFSHGTISVTKSCHDSWVNGEYVKVIDRTKTACSERVIPLPKQVMGYMKTLRSHTGAHYVVTTGRSRDGAEVRSYQRTFETLLVRLKIEHRGFHALRHTFATRALEVGMDVKTLSEILGHKNPNITLRRYAHSLIEHKTEMMNRLGKTLPTK